MGSSILLRCYSRGGTSPLAYQWAKLADGYGGGHLPSGTIQGECWWVCAHPGRFPGVALLGEGDAHRWVSLSVSVHGGCSWLRALRYVGVCVHLCPCSCLYQPSSMCSQVPVHPCERQQGWG